MIDRTFALVVGTILTVLVWTAVAQMVLGDSRQRCTASADICAWELR